MTTRRRRLVVVAVAVTAGAVGAGWAASRDGPPDTRDGGYQLDARPSEAEVARFSQVMGLAFTGLVADAATFPDRVAEVASGSRPAAELAGVLDASLARVAGTRDLVGASADLPDLPAVRQLYLHSALLYAEALWALRAGVDVGGTAREAAVRQAQRLKILSDRVYDRGTALADPDLAPAGAVPDWQAGGLAPDAPAGGAPGGWWATLDAFVAGAGPRLAALPGGWNAEVARLALLVDAEAVEASGAPIPERSRRLALIGEDLWASASSGPPGQGLGDHPRSGFDRAGLEPQPVPGLGGGLGAR